MNKTKENLQPDIIQENIPKCDKTTTRKHIWEAYNVLLYGVSATQHYLRCKACYLIDNRELKIK